MVKAVFLDRDGVINRKPPGDDYVTRWEGFQVLPGVVKGIAELNHAGFCVIVVTNQRCIAKGLMTTAELEAMHHRMSEFLARDGATIDAVYYCPHETKTVCGCRKPAPGMLLDAAREHGIELAASWMVGDSDADIEAGKSAGCKTARLSPRPVAGGERNPGRAASKCADIVAYSLLNAVGKILQWEKAADGSLRPVDAAHRIFGNASVAKRNL